MKETTNDEYTKPRYAMWGCPHCDLTIYDASDKDIDTHIAYHNPDIVYCGNANPGGNVSISYKEGRFTTGKKEYWQ